MANTCFPTRTSKVWMIARVNGILMDTRVPWFAHDSISTWPLIFSTSFLTTSIPTPRPEVRVTFLLVEKPGTNLFL